MMPEPSSKRCLACGYILEGLPENRCPECGRAFDPADRTTYRTHAPVGRRRWYLFLLQGAPPAAALWIVLCVGLALIISFLLPFLMRLRH